MTPPTVPWDRRGGSSGGARRGVLARRCMPSLLLACTLLQSAAALSEKEVLHHIYGNLNGDNWDTAWDISGEDPCDESNYPGVKCNDNGHVIEIDLSDNNMAGSISPHVYTLPHLKNLDFSKNRITNAGWDRIDEVVTGDTLVSDVEVIDLTNNLINSVEGVGALKDSLTGLHMTYNNLKGTMPDELFQLEKLEILAISENALTGEIDARLGGLTDLLELYCYGNKITGSIPTEIGQLTKMQILTVSWLLQCLIHR